PVEICEPIIDSLSDLWGSRYDAYWDWRSTALVCAAWLPRSRFNLYREVQLGHDSGQASLLLQTLEENSHLAHLVVKLELSG
ncbi:hypothetical protein C8Q74DRAFT_1165378, partial [Fomes fomentarius]